jgi:hypothetical protein
MSPCGSKNTINYAAQKSKSFAWKVHWVLSKVLFLEAEKEDSKKFLIKMWSQYFTRKKSICLHIFLLRQRTSFGNLSKVVYNLFLYQHILILKQYCLMCRCFVWCLKNAVAASAVTYWVLQRCSIMCTYMRSSRVKHEFNVLSTKDKLHSFESSNQ